MTQLQVVNVILETPQQWGERRIYYVVRAFDEHLADVARLLDKMAVLSSERAGRARDAREILRS